MIQRFGWNFIALSHYGSLFPYDWIYWGPKDVLQAYFENPTSLNVPILRVGLSTNVAQTGPNSFNDGESNSFCETMRKQDPNFDFFETQWGDYPVYAIKTTMEGHVIYAAWVGLNDPERGRTLLFSLVYPEKQGHPNKKDHELWENFLKKTTQLTDQGFFKAWWGQD